MSDTDRLEFPVGARGGAPVQSTWRILRLNTLQMKNEDKLNNKEIVLNIKSRNKFRKSLVQGIKQVVLLNKIIEINWKTREIEMARQAKFEDIVIPIFDGENYSSWKIRLMMLLEYKECKDPADRIRNEAEDETQWKKKDLKARTILISTITDKQLEYVKDCTTAREMITQFDKIYVTQSTSLQIICRGKLEEIKLKNYDRVDEFFVEFEKAVNEFKAAGGNIEEAEKMRYLIRALPPNYSYIGDFIDVIPEQQRTVDYVKSKIKEKNMSKNEFDKKGNMSTFTAKFEGKCFFCGKTGHRQKDCWSQKGQQGNRGRGAQRGRPNYGQRGNSRGRVAQSGRGRGVGRHPDQQRGEASSEQRSATTTEADSTEAWVTQVVNPQINQVTGCESNQNYNELLWLLDSGCTDHIVQNDKFFDNYVNLKEPINVKLPDGKILKATKVGNIEVQFKNYYNVSNIVLNNVYYVNGIKQNLLSLSKITQNCTVVARNENAKIYNKYRKLLAIAYKKENLYFMKSLVNKSIPNETYVNNVKLTEKERWHRALGHVNFQYLNKLVNDKLAIGLPSKIENIDMKCANCIESKMSNVPFKNDRSKTSEILELLHTDLNGPHNTIGYGGEKYFLTFIDDYSKCTRIFCIKNKSETASCFIEFVNQVENILNKRVKKLQCDNGKEYLNKDIYEFIKFKGIQLQPCPPYVHELNGVAERYNRSAMDIGRCLIREARIHRRYWPEVMKTVAYLKNRTIANTKENKTPYEIFFGKRPNVQHLKIYGSRIFVRVPEALRQSKWDNKAELGILVGYTENGYRVLVNNRVINARHVEVVEQNIELICLEKSDDEKDRVIVNSENEGYDNNESPSTMTLESGRGEEIYSDDVNNNQTNNKNCENFESNESETNRQDLKVPRKSDRKKSPINRFGNPVSHFIYVNYVDANTPSTFEEALNSKESHEWQIAMNKEISSLVKNATWEIVDRPIDKEIIDVKWVYKRKNDNTYKARLVVRGFQQKEYVENVYSPVGKMQTLKILLSYSCKNKLFIEQMDVETAFLNGDVKSEVYVNVPKGYEVEKNKVCKLRKALYGLRESPRAWYECFNEYVKRLNFERSKYDYCLYVNNTGKDPIYIY